MYDPPGVGTESVSDSELDDLVADARRRRTLAAERGLEEMERRGWESCVVVADSSAIGVACRLASMRPDAVQGLALGHACLSFDSEGERAPINGEVRSAMQGLSTENREDFARHALSQVTGGSFDEEHAGRIVERVPMKLLMGAWLQGGDESI